MESARQKIRRLLTDHPEMSVRQISFLAGEDEKYVYSVRTDLRHPDLQNVASRRWKDANRERVRATWRKLYCSQRGGARPPNDTIIKLSYLMGYDDIAKRFHISRNVVAGVVHRARKRGLIARPSAP